VTVRVPRMTLMDVAR